MFVTPQHQVKELRDEAGRNIVGGTMLCSELGGGDMGGEGRGDRKGKRGKRRYAYAYVRTSTVETLDDSGLLFYFCVFLSSCKLIIIWRPRSEANSAADILLLWVILCTTIRILILYSRCVCINVPFSYCAIFSRIAHSNMHAQ